MVEKFGLESEKNNMPENIEKKFEELMKKQGLEKFAKPNVYVAKLPIHEGGRPTQIETFKTKEERDKWYETIGREIENVYGAKIEFDEEPAEDDE